MSGNALKRSIFRLRNAEQRLRALSFLVSLDVERGNLWLFLSKKEMEESGETAVTKADIDLRYSGCRPAVPVGSTVKASDLLLEGNTQLRQLFMSAVVALVSRTFQTAASAIPLNARTFYIPRSEWDAETGSAIALPERSTPLLCSVNVELYSDGLVWITTDGKPCASTQQLSQLLDQDKTDSIGPSMDVWMAPFGRRARFTRSESENRSPRLSSPLTAMHQSSSTQEKASSDAVKSSIWKQSVCNWLAVHGVDKENLQSEEWVTIEVLVKSSMATNKVHSTGRLDLRDQYHLRKVIWPSSLCVTRAKLPMDHEKLDHSELSPPADPLKFAEDWFNGEGSRIDAIGKKKAAQIARQLQQDQLKAREATVEEESSDSLNTFPRSYQDNTATSGIYPTPPDGALSQATPGPPFDTSLDTPEDTGSVSHAARRDTTVSQDRSIGLFESGQANLNATAASYDEDLFEDSGGADFVAEGITDEPDWDFFNEPDKVPAANDDVLMEDASDVVFARGVDGDIKAENIVQSDATNPAEHTQAETTTVSSDQYGKDLESLNQPESQSIVTEQPMILVNTKVKSRSPSSENSNIPNNDCVGELDPHDPNEIPEKEQVDGQQLGSYKSVPTERLGGPRDDKYGASGRFWFSIHDPDWNKIAAASMDSRTNSVHVTDSKPTPSQTDVHDSSTSKEATNSRTGLKRTLSDQSSVGSSFVSDSPDPYALLETQAANGNEIGVGEHVYLTNPVDMEIDEKNTDQLQTESLDLLELLQTDASEWPIADLFDDPVPVDYLEGNFSDEDYTKIVQLSVDQVTQSSFQACPELSLGKWSDFILQSILERMQQTVFGIGVFTLHDLAATPEPILEKIQTPRILIKRDNEPLQALTSILPFWEAFSLEPASGAKDIEAICIYPDNLLSLRAINDFLDRVGLAYSSCHLGSHKRYAGSTILDGLAAWNSKDPQSVQSLAQTCKTVGKALHSNIKPGSTFVIYIVNPFLDERHAKLSICAAFLQLFKNYIKSGSPSSLQDIDIALQIIPCSFVQSADTVMIAPQRVYARLAIEVYNRCPPANRTNDFASCGPAVMLATPVSKQLTFELSDMAESPLRSEEKFLHAAYCQTPDERWVAAAWSDSDGRLNLTTSYRLRRLDSSVCRQRSEIIKEIWETSLDIVAASEQARKYRWRLVVVKDCPMEPAEVNEWNVLVQGQVTERPSGAPSIGVTLLTMGTRPNLKLKVGQSNASSSAQFVAGGSQTTPQQGNVTFGTPVSTPTNSQPVLSPEHLMFSAPTPASTGASLGNASTPPAMEHNFDVDADSILINPTDESEYLLLPSNRSINNSNSILEKRLAKQSAYLFQRVSPHNTAHQGWIGVGIDVNLVQVTSARTSYGNNLDEKSDQASLKDILTQYRGLITIAKTKGMTPRRDGVLLPWHLETAARSIEILSVFS